MLLSGLLGHLALISVVCGAIVPDIGFDEGVLLDFGLSVRLRQGFEAIKRQPKAQDTYIANRKLADQVEKLLWMIVNHLQEFIHIRARYEPAWKDTASRLPWIAD